MASEQFKTLCLYYFPIGPPSRAVMLTAKVLGIELNLNLVDLTKGEHMKPQFLQINPEHKVPTLDDNGFVIWESRVIMIYLTEKYGKNESLYPRDSKQRAKINQFLYFDIDRLYGCLTAYFVPAIMENKEFDKNKLAELEKAFKYLDTILHEKEYVVGVKLTLADLALVTTVATADLAANFSLKPYPNIEKWYKNLHNILPGYEEIIENYTKDMKNFMNNKK